VALELVDPAVEGGGAAGEQGVRLLVQRGERSGRAGPGRPPARASA
jgi:hypothetical protein